MKRNVIAIGIAMVLLIASYTPAYTAPPLKPEPKLPPVPFLPAPERHKVITADELKDMMRRGPRPLIVDVREPALFRKGHIPGAINIPFDEAKKRVLHELDPKDHIVFVCHGGPMGDELGEMLTRNNYRHVYNLKRGMKGWDGPVAR